MWPPNEAEGLPPYPHEDEYTLGEWYDELRQPWYRLVARQEHVFETIPVRRVEIRMIRPNRYHQFWQTFATFSIDMESPVEGY